jgi:hypothetical protein
MKKIILIGLTVLTLTNLGLGQEVSTEPVSEVQIEEYVPKVIIEGKWGTGEGEFGRDEGFQKFYDPTSLAADSLGNIYILDVVNNRIQKFNNEGKYLLSIPVDSFKGKAKYWEGKPIENPFMKGRYTTIPTEAEGINIVIDSQDNLYYYLIKGEKGEVWQFKEDKLVKKWEVEKGKYLDWEERELWIRDVIYAKEDYSVFEKKNYSREKLEKARNEKNKERKFKLESKDENSLIFVNPAGKRLKIKNVLNMRFDEEGITTKNNKFAIFVNEDRKKWSYFYDLSGKLMSKLKAESYPSVVSLRDEEGNFYSVEATEKILKVIKYTKEATNE